MDKVKEEKKCEFYDDYECNAYYNIYPEPEDCQRDLCRTHKDCYYRQLKRLQHYQAEFEHELMNDYTYDGYISPNGFTPIDVIKHIKSELKRLQQENERLKEESDKLKQALRDIRECATTEMVEIATRKDYNGFLALQGISAKINEVIGAE